MELTEREQMDLWDKLVAATDEYFRTALLSFILRPESDETLVLTAPTARLLADRAAALEARVADAAQILGGISLTHPHLVPAEWAERGGE